MLATACPWGNCKTDFLCTVLHFSHSHLHTKVARHSVKQSFFIAQWMAHPFLKPGVKVVTYHDLSGFQNITSVFVVVVVFIILIWDWLLFLFICQLFASIQCCLWGLHGEFNLGTCFSLLVTLAMRSASWFS